MSAAKLDAAALLSYPQPDKCPELVAIAWRTGDRLDPRPIPECAIDLTKLASNRSCAGPSTKRETDSTGNWTARQYAIDAGWDYSCIEATAEKGVSETDAEGLSDAQQAVLLEYCKTSVAENSAKLTALNQSPATVDPRPPA